MCAFFPFGFEGGMWDLIVFVPDHCLSFILIINELLGILVSDLMFCPESGKTV